ncbi:hypothetical protein D3C72_2037860 [compost metagenome]
MVSVALSLARWLTASTSMDRPSTSDSRMNSWRTTPSHIFPVSVKKRMPCSHSSSLSSTSLAKACRWRTRLCTTRRRRGSGVLAKAATAWAEIFASLGGMLFILCSRGW